MDGEEIEECKSLNKYESKASVFEHIRERKDTINFSALAPLTTDGLTKAFGLKWY